MTLAAEAADMLIGSFGEEVTVYPQISDQPDDSEDPMYFSQSPSPENEYQIKVRVYSSPSQEMLDEYGFDEDTEAVIYENQNAIGEADEIEYSNQRFIVRRTITNQIGEGPYIWIHNLVGI